MADTITHGLLVVAVVVFLPIMLGSMAIGLMSRGRIDELGYFKGIADGIVALFGMLLLLCGTVVDVVWEKMRGNARRSYQSAGDRAYQRAFKISAQYALAIGVALAGLFLIGLASQDHRTEMRCPKTAPVYCPDPRGN